MRGLGEFEQTLLFAVLRLGKEAYGARIRAEIRARAGRSAAVGAIYTGLDRLQARGFVSSWVGEATPVRGGRRKKYYRLEPAGAVALHEAWLRVRSMGDGVIPQLSRLAHSAGQR